MKLVPFSLTLLFAAASASAIQPALDPRRTAADAPTPLPAHAATLAAKANRSLDRSEIDFLSAWNDLFGLLPLDDLAECRMDDGVMTLVFDFAGAEHRDVEFAEKRSVVLRRGRRGFDLRNGRTKTSKQCGRKVRVLREVELRYDLEAGITGVRKGDLSIYAWLKRRPLEVSSFWTERRLAKDRDGNLVLMTDSSGREMRRRGEVVPKAFERWIRISCSGRSFDCGVGRALDGTELVEAGSR